MSVSFQVCVISFWMKKKEQKKWILCESDCLLICVHDLWYIRAFEFWIRSVWILTLQKLMTNIKVKIFFNSFYDLCSNLINLKISSLSRPLMAKLTSNIELGLFLLILTNSQAWMVKNGRILADEVQLWWWRDRSRSFDLGMVDRRESGEGRKEAIIVVFGKEVMETRQYYFEKRVMHILSKADAWELCI